MILDPEYSLSTESFTQKSSQPLLQIPISLQMKDASNQVSTKQTCILLEMTDWDCECDPEYDVIVNIGDFGYPVKRVYITNTFSSRRRGNVETTL